MRSLNVVCLDNRNELICRCDLFHSFLLTRQYSIGPQTETCPRQFACKTKTVKILSRDELCMGRVQPRVGWSCITGDESGRVWRVVDIF